MGQIGPSPPFSTHFREDSTSPQLLLLSPLLEKNYAHHIGNNYFKSFSRSLPPPTRKKTVHSVHICFCLGMGIGAIILSIMTKGTFYFEGGQQSIYRGRQAPPEKRGDSPPKEITRGVGSPPCPPPARLIMTNFLALNTIISNGLSTITILM